MSRPSNAGQARSERQWFSTTHWSVFLSLQDVQDAKAAEALEKLCRTYWPPLYTYVRRHGHGPEDAQDLTQAFFAKMLEKNFWARADRKRGRFRAFLLTAFRQFLLDERDRARTAKRGGGVSFIPFDEEVGEEHLANGLNLSSEQQFERQWALTVLKQARAALHRECVATGKAALYERVNLLGDQKETPVPYAAIAQDLGMSVSALKTAVSRLRERYGEFVREEVAQTVSSPAEIDSEIRHLLSVIGA